MLSRGQAQLVGPGPNYHYPDSGNYFTREFL